VSVSVRLARPDEYERVGDLTVEWFTKVVAYGDDDPYLEVLRDTAPRAQHADLLVAVDESGDLVGTATACRYGTKYADIARDGEVEVRMLAVDPGHGRRGIGRALMTYIHERGRADRFTSVVLSVISSNTAAVDFYTSLGYARVPERDWTPIPDWEFVLEVFEHPL
jgi:ribosomal protein S18 acetylase RimI-like enzyme